MTGPRYFVFGHGYSAGHYVATLDPKSVEGVTVRTRDKASQLAAHGLKPFVFDGEHPTDGIASALYRATHLLVSVPPGHEAPAGAHVGGANARPGDPVLRWYENEIAHGSPNLEWIGYLSTVGVYGDHDGGWVDETAEVRPVSARSRERVAAEAAWQKAAATRGVPLAILRLSGIYGPGRNGFVNLATREWKDGLLSSTMRDLANAPDTNPKWIILDGDLDANWIESMIRDPSMDDRGKFLFRTLVNENTIFGIIMTLIARALIEFIFWVSGMLWRLVNPPEPQPANPAARPVSDAPPTYYQN